ncbi:hypothetical protein AU195_16815 [Mycobacterium sp. IS-1496]|uniref:DUF4185 domain-containing protein n=1 Tax=Mycobacterium sp. IS-1496 TaxID=1772284 RepID=UPI0007417208|nr:DUF4185 domain-containing protein [Mycobacterium sp. IS-1496]KUI36924.1 hypothetical protein AU195_16815 [Mycobacterium sp. IS-1496]
MRSKTSAAAHVGRIGALAVALGVGAAVTLGNGVAAAETGGSSSSSESSSSPASDSPSPASESDQETAAPDDEGEAADESDDEPALDEDEVDEDLDKDTAEDELDAEPTVDDEPVTPAEEVELGDVEPVETEAETATGTPQQSPPSDDDERTDDTTAEATVETEIDVVVEEPRSAETPVEPAAEPAEIAPLDGGRADDAVRTDSPMPAAAPVLARAAAPSTRSLPSVPPELPKAFSALLAAVGLAPLIANLPAAPAPPPALWALLASARREFEHAFTRPVTTAPAQSNIVAAAAVTPYPTTLPSVNKGWVTGKVPNNFGIGGTDLGIMWDGGVRLGERFVHVAFGDTFANSNMTGDWRSNVLLISTDHNLSNGLQLVQTGYAGRFIGPFKGRLGLFGSEVTQIPTSGIQIDGRQFVNFMSVKSWDTPGRWTTNYSAISVYDPATDKWVLAPSTIRSAGWFRSTTRYVPGSQNFQQAAYVLQPEDQVGEDGVRYLYAFGTPSGRAGSAYISRVAEGSVTDLSKYEYWDGSTWVRNRPAVAAPIIGDSKRSTGLFGFVVDWANDPNVFGGYLGGLFGAKTGGNVSEMSVQYNEYLGKYVVLYGDGNNNIRLRTADTPEGPWSAPVTVATSKQYPGLYAPMIHPWSGTGDLKDGNNEPDLNNLYWNMSLWGDYNVVLMQTDLSPLKAVYV